MQEQIESTSPGRGRIALLCTAVLLMAGAIAVRLYQVQVVDSEAFRARASNQHNSTVSSAPTPGAIVDRDGRALAVSLETESLYAHPQRVDDKLEAAALLAQVLDESPAKLRQQLESNRRFVYLKRFLDPETVAKIKALDIPVGKGQPFDFLPEAKRLYPKGPLAVHVLGFANIDGKGVEGIEQRYEDVLRGSPSTYFVTRDAKKRLVRKGVNATGRQPHDVVLTLDSVLQHMVERELDLALEDTGAKAASAILLDPATGHVLALANRPAVDPNHYGSGTDEQRRNRALVDFYEPGSTFKPVPLALALDSGAVNASEKIFCENGEWRIPGRQIGDTSRNGLLSVRQVLAKSSNIGMVKAIQDMPPRTLQQGIREFGFGQKTGIELSGESAGLARDVEQWSGFTQASLSFGQEIGVTVLQMASALGAIANDGVRIPPRVVLGTRDASGTLIQAQTATASRVISSVTAAQVRSMMETVIESGTGTRAQVDGYSLAGKSGTAQKAVPGGYSETDYMASFGGFGPSDSPKLVAMVVLDTPVGKWTHGGQVAAPVFGRIMAAAMPHMRIPAINNELQWASADAASPTLDAAHRRGRADVEQEALQAGVVPNLIGLDLRAAVRHLAELGYRAMIDGEGLVIGQRPAPGTPLESGEICRVRLGSDTVAGGPAPDPSTSPGVSDE